MKRRHPVAPASAEFGDDARVRRAARRVGVLVGGSSALIVSVGIAVLIVGLMGESRRERPAGPPGIDADRVVVDIDDVVPWLIGFAVFAVAALALIAWLSARRSVRPLVQALQLQRTFVADASHELRTPLTALVSRVQILERRLARGEPTAEVVAKLRRDADAMSDTLTDLLLAASAESGRHDASGECSPVAAAHAAVDRLGPLADARGVHLTVSPHSPSPGDTRVPLGIVACTRLWIVLIDNAIAHSPQGAAVVVDSHDESDTVELRVSDAGSGIDPKQTERLFERFARGAGAERRTGFGLGLALARDLAHGAGGSLTVEHTSPSGTTFLVTLPRSSTHRDSAE